MASKLIRQKRNEARYHYAGFHTHDTSTLVNHEVLANGANIHSYDTDPTITGTHQHEEIGLASPPCRLDSPFYGRGLTLDNLRSPSSECSTTVSSLSTATGASPLDARHRYHLYLAHHPTDGEWVKQAVSTLEAPPYNYTCCYSARLDFSDGVTAVQNALCSVMLSRRVVLVLSPNFLHDTWREYEETLAHVTSLTQRRQKTVVLVLHDCDVPEGLRGCSPIYVTDTDFWDNFLQGLQLDDMSLSGSIHTIKSPSFNMSGYQNGEILAKLSACVQGYFNCRLRFDHDEVPETLAACEVGLSRNDYADAVLGVGRAEVGDSLPWVFTAVPSLILLTVFLFWCAAFVLVILLYPDNQTSTLPIRLCVFTVPAVCIVLGCLFKWKKLKRHKEKYSMRMFSRSIYMNAVLSARGKPVIVTSSKTSDDVFHIYFVFFSRYDCEEQVKLCLSHCTEEELDKLCRLVDVYTLTNSYLKQKPLACRLTVMMSSAYAINLIYRRVPHTLEKRHCRRRQCLCQFIQEFLASYLPCINREANLLQLAEIFSRYLNCDLRPDPIVLHSLGINIVEG